MDQYVGEIRQVGFTFAPPGWLFCDGSMLSIAQYDTLYALLGTTYGGDGVSTFALPDLRGRTPLGQGTSSSGTYVTGTQGGSEQVTLNVQQLPAHGHSIQASSNSTSAIPTNSTFGPSTTSQYEPLVTGSPSAVMLSAVGGGQPHENRMPFIVLNYIISTAGVYPSQS